MGHIKEPAGVDLLVKSRLLTKEEEIGIASIFESIRQKTIKNICPQKVKLELETLKKL